MKKLLILTCVFFAIVNLASADTKDIKGKNRIVFGDCHAVSGIEGKQDKRLTISERGSKICLRETLNRECYETGTNYRFWQCEDDVLQAATAQDPDNFVTLDLSASDFPKIKSKLAQECKNIVSFPGSFIYKVVGSKHISPSDCRRHSVAFVQNSSIYGTHSCVTIRDSLGNAVGEMGRYYPNGHYAARYYGCAGCSNETLTGGMVSSRARAKTGNTNIYIDMGTTCVGPINGGACKNSSGC
jgi:hypothetical protein